ncbi:MAG: tripartite tricarboxylate transporter substrate binding protein [Betaproteobacteria bacterium]|nr:tripartite tricarboxylate transporter substrate binding protein [Betaproteobacteria bacterium]
MTTVARAPLLRVVLSLIGIAAGPALAQDSYPSRPVRFIVPASATAPIDIMARLYAQQLSDAWRQPVIVDNRAGATGTIGADAVVKAEPNGYTLLFTTDLPLVQAPNVLKIPYDPRKDLVPIAGVADTLLMLVVNPTLGIKTLADLVTAAKAKPGSLTFGSAGIGSPAHLCGEIVKSAANVDMRHIPYKGSAPAILAAVTGEVSMFCGPITQGLPQVRAGKLIAVGTSGARPSALTPELKPLADTWPGLTVTTWFAVLAPVGTPAAILGKVRDALKKLNEDAANKRTLQSIGVDVLWWEPAQVSAAIEADLRKWGDAGKKAGLSAQQ